MADCYCASLNEPCFLADAMLGRLARWLRVLGFDTRFNPAQDDRDLVKIAAAEQRVLLTRDRHLINHLRPERGLLLTCDAPLDQLREVVERCELTGPAQLFLRCLVCNAALRAATAEEMVMGVPAEVDRAGCVVRYCPGCERLYWPGSHTRRMREKLEQALPDWVLTM